MIIPVGPDEREPGRLRAVVSELRAHEHPAAIRLIVIDDAPVARALEFDWPDRQVVRTPLWAGARPDPHSAMVAGTLEGLRHVRELEFAVKLDTDAAVIAPFSARLRAAFADPGLGVVGAYDRAPDGGQRDWGVWRRTIDRAARPVQLTLRGAGPRIRIRPPEERRFVAEVRRRAYAAAPAGAHCLGGAYAVSGAFLTRAALDWGPWLGTKLSEDVVVGLLALHAGLRMQSLTRPGEPFGVRWRGLPAPPAELIRRGYGIVHSVRAADASAEAALRRALQGAG